MEKVYGLAEAQPFIGLSLEQIRNLVKAGEIKAIRPGGGRYYIPESELKRIQQDFVTPTKARE